MWKHLGKYELLRTLGQGAMGEVYLAHHPAIDREVAIKTILPSAAKGEDAEERFRREATAAGKLNHPNIVTIYDFDKDGDLLYLVMEYVKGEDLEDIIALQSMTPTQFLEVLAQVCDGLSYAHRNGIVHRDIKPSNIRVIRDGKRILAKVMDFGIARTQDSSMTATGIVMGTVSYMAPEYIQTGRSSAQGDLWAVGVMLYECLSCRKPFGGDNTTTILFKIVSETPAPIDPEDLQGISPSIRDILDRALAKAPAERFQTAEEFARSLRACKDPSWRGVLEATSALTPGSGLPGRELTALLPPDPGASSLGAATILAPPRPPLPPTLPTPRARPALLALAGAGLLLVGGAGAYFFLGRRGPAPVAPPVAMSPAVVPARTAIAGSTSAPPPVKTPSVTPTKPPPAVPIPQPPPPPDETPAERLAKAAALIDSDPGQAVTILRGLSGGDAQVQGNLLAALYRKGDAAAFESALDAAKVQGLSGPQMMKAAPAFRLAMVDELRAHKAKNGTQLLSLAAVAKVVN